MPGKPAKAALATRSYAIGEVSRLSGLSHKTIRYYEEIGVVSRARRARNGYRMYAMPDVNILRFVARARSLGFPVEEVRRLVELWRDPGRTSREVQSLARTHLSQVEDKIAALESLRRVLSDLIDRCHGDDRRYCPIVDRLAGEATFQEQR